MTGTVRRRGGLILVAAAAILLWLWVTVPLALGGRTLYLRDVFTTHVPLKAFGADELRQGRIPAFNPTWALGQPFRGNPNALPFYPGNVLYLVLPFWSAFNLHYALHWLLAALAMAALARGLGLGAAAALVAGLTYAGSGWILSGLTFYNLLAVSAWWPLVMLGAVKGGRRGIAFGGLACGLALLGGEPVTAALGTVPLLLAAFQRHGWRRGMATVLGIGGLGLLIALPQIVATARILGFTTRGALGGGAGRFHLGAARLIELIIPFPFGLPWDVGRAGYRAWDDQPGLPYVLTLHLGIVALWLALLGARRARGWALLATSGLVLAWAGALGGDALAVLSGGLVRYPEKLLVWTALAAPLLAGWGLERVLENPRAWRGAAAGAGLSLMAAGTAFATGVPGGRAGIWTVSLVLAAAFLGLAAVAARRGSAAGLAAAQLAALLPLGGLVATAPVSDFAPSSWVRLLGPGAQVVLSNLASPLGERESRYELPDPSYRTLVRLGSFDLGPAPGVLHGLRYPLAHDLDGLYSPLSSLVLTNLPRLDWVARANWLRALGTTAAVLEESPGTAELRLAASQERLGGTSRLFLVRDPAPPAGWPRSVIPAANPVEAFRAVSRSPDPVANVVVSQPVRHAPGAAVQLLGETPDRIDVEVSGDGGLLVLRRAYQPLYRGTAEGRSLPTLPTNLALLGVEVPPGTHRVRIEATAGPEKVAGGVAVLTFLAALALAWRR